MAGKPGRSGRLPDVKLADDTDGVIAMEFPSAAPKKPGFVSQVASELWDVFVEQLIYTGRLKIEDAPLLQSACELWGLYRASYDSAQRNPTDRDSRIAVTSYWAKFEQATARFGLNPADRQRLKTPLIKQGVRRRQA